MKNKVESKIVTRNGSENFSAHNNVLIVFETKSYYDRKRFFLDFAKKCRGFTLVEMMVVIGVLGIIMIAVSNFQVNVLNNNRYSEDALSSAQDARIILRTMVKELRSASPGNNGSFPIIQAGTNSISFYSDIDGDGLKEKIRYFIDGTSLKKGLIKPSGSPLIYNSANEIITFLAYNIRNTTSNPIFEYFNSSYSGTGSSLAQPVSVKNVHLIKISLMIDVNINRAPNSRVYTTQVTLRNLKDNL